MHCSLAPIQVVVVTCSIALPTTTTSLTRGMVSTLSQDAACDDVRKGLRVLVDLTRVALGLRISGTMLPSLKTLTSARVSSITSCCGVFAHTLFWPLLGPQSQGQC
jgi:hypothetical protein